MLPLDWGAQLDVQSNSSYFKFNLDYMSFYNWSGCRITAITRQRIGLCATTRPRTRMPFSTWWMRRSQERTHPAMAKCARCWTNGCKGPNGKRMWIFPGPSRFAAARPASRFRLRSGRLWNSCGRSTPSNSRAEATNHRRLGDRLHSAVLDGPLLRSDCGRRSTIGRRAE